MDPNKKEMVFRVISLVLLVVFLLCMILIYLKIKGMDPSVACTICQSKGNNTCYKNEIPNYNPSGNDFKPIPSKNLIP